MKRLLLSGYVITHIEKHQEYKGKQSTWYYHFWMSVIASAPLCRVLKKDLPDSVSSMTALKRDSVSDLANQIKHMLFSF